MTTTTTAAAANIVSRWVQDVGAGVTDVTLDLFATSAGVDDALPDLVPAVVGDYNKHRRAGESFYDFLKRHERRPANVEWVHRGEPLSLEERRALLSQLGRHVVLEVNEPTRRSSATGLIDPDSGKDHEFVVYELGAGDSDGAGYGVFDADGVVARRNQWLTTDIFPSFINDVADSITETMAAGDRGRAVRRLLLFSGLDGGDEIACAAWTPSDADRTLMRNYVRMVAPRIVPVPVEPADRLVSADFSKRLDEARCTRHDSAALRSTSYYRAHIARQTPRIAFANDDDDPPGLVAIGDDDDGPPGLVAIGDDDEAYGEGILSSIKRAVRKGTGGYSTQVALYTHVFVNPYSGKSPPSDAAMLANANLTATDLRKLWNFLEWLKDMKKTRSALQGVGQTGSTDRETDGRLSHGTRLAGATAVGQYLQNKKRFTTGKKKLNEATIGAFAAIAIEANILQRVVKDALNRTKQNESLGKRQTKLELAADKAAFAQNPSAWSAKSTTSSAHRRGGPGPVDTWMDDVAVYNLDHVFYAVPMHNPLVTRGWVLADLYSRHYPVAGDRSRFHVIVPIPVVDEAIELARHAEVVAADTRHWHEVEGASSAHRDDPESEPTGTLADGVYTYTLDTELYASCSKCGGAKNEPGYPVVLDVVAFIMRHDQNIATRVDAANMADGRRLALAIARGAYGKNAGRVVAQLSREEHAALVAWTIKYDPDTFTRRARRVLKLCDALGACSSAVGERARTLRAELVA